MTTNYKLYKRHDTNCKFYLTQEPPFVQPRNKEDKQLYETGHPEWEGFCIDILMEIVKLVPFEFNITRVSSEQSD